VAVAGSVLSWRGVKRITARALCVAERYEAGDLIATSTRNAEELLTELRELVRHVGDRELRRLVNRVFADTEFRRRFLEAPGSQSYHHAWLHGLVEHTVAVGRACAMLAPTYNADADLLLAAALLHDIGKVDELTVGTSIGYTDEGRLLGHVMLGVRRVRDAAAAVGISAEKLLMLEHAIVSHHGELEWGSPKRPATLEALLLHHVDNLDAKASGLSGLLSRALASDERWTDSSNLFRRPLFAPKSMEDERPRHLTEDEAYLCSA
jgi:3'-5' exoribonuclease